MQDSTVPNLLLEAFTIGGSAVVGLASGLFLSRRRMRATLVSLRPSGLTQMWGYAVELPRDLKEALESFHWKSLQRSLQDFEDLAELAKFVRNAKLLRKASNPALALLDETLAVLQSPSHQSAEVQAALSRIVSNPILFQYLMGMTWRKELEWDPPPPDPGESKPLVPFEDDPIGAGAKGVYGHFVIEFPGFQAHANYHDPIERGAMEALCWGICLPQMSRLKQNLGLVKQNLLENIALAQTITETGDTLLRERSRWVVQVQISNVGKSAGAISPDALLFARCGKTHYEPIKLVVRTDEDDSSVDSKAESGMRQSERDLRQYGVTLDPTDEQSRTNIVLAPQEAKVVNFVSRASIADEPGGSELLSFWERGMPDYRIKLTVVPRGPRLSAAFQSSWSPV